MNCDTNTLALYQAKAAAARHALDTYKQQVRVQLLDILINDLCSDISLLHIQILECHHNDNEYTKELSTKMSNLMAIKDALVAIKDKLAERGI